MILTSRSQFSEENSFYTLKSTYPIKNFKIDLIKDNLQVKMSKMSFPTQGSYWLLHLDHPIHHNIKQSVHDRSVCVTVQVNDR